MNQKFRKILLGAYDLILSIGAIYIGILMVQSSSGIFAEYPKEWLSKIPFISWFIPGIIVIILFGFGNLIASLFSFKSKDNKSWLVSALFGGVLFISLVLQAIILGECYLATIEFFILSIIQLCFSGYVFCGYHKIVKISHSDK